MREIVVPLCHSLGIGFLGDERGDDFYRATISRNGQSAAIVIPDAQIRVLVAKQLEDVAKAWREQEADFTNKVAQLDKHVSQSLHKKGFGDNRGFAERFSDYTCHFKAGGEDRQVKFTSEEIQTRTLDQLLAEVEVRINGA